MDNREDGLAVAEEERLVVDGSVTILGDGHQLCQRCGEYLYKFDKKLVVKNLIYSAPYHQHLPDLRVAACLPCYICANNHEEQATGHSAILVEDGYRYQFWSQEAEPYTIIVGPMDGHNFPSVVLGPRFVVRKSSPCSSSQLNHSQ